MNAVEGSIKAYLKTLRIIAEPTLDVFKGDRTGTGDVKELTVAEFISCYLPLDFRLEKGIIYSRQEKSASIDCVILAPNHPKMITPERKVLLAEGVYAAVEVKPDIRVLSDNSEFLRGLIQIKTVKCLTRKTEFSGLPGDKGANAVSFFSSDKIPAILFSFKSAPAMETMQFMIEKIKEGELTINDLPDLIVTMDKGLILYTSGLSDSPLYNALSPAQKLLFSNQAFVHFTDTAQEKILVGFLAFLLNFQPPAFLLNRFILHDYLQDYVKTMPCNIIPLSIVEVTQK
ncbi:MAG TPA: DUF6602 domain-containing protein [Puia sp.]|jgi:hypothetical protein|nr:DUF6602 domain-containing protein [Puia sp.]